MNAIELQDVIVRFDGLIAVSQLSFAVREGSIHSLIGPNGAGKTTVSTSSLACMTPQPERQLYGDRLLRSGRMPSQRLESRAPSRTPSLRRDQALENVLVGRTSPATTASWGHLRRRSFSGRSSTCALELNDLLEVVGLSAAATGLQAAPAGKQRQLEIARAMASGPRLLLLDEPAAGLRSAELDGS